MTTAQNQNIAIGSDAPLTDPSQDAFGYAPFARRIAEAVCKTPSPQGLVMAIHGSWGVGKSTLLNFIKHDLGRLPADERPIIVDFNPWWFSSREHLATQFLMQFRAKLAHESEILRAIGDKMADYGAAIGSTIAKVYGIPWLDKPIGFLLKFFKRTPKDVPALKTEIADALKRANQRFVLVVDDIDRLAPDEMRELFKVVKALADFPNVIYLLSFDRKLVADSLATSLGVDGDAYIEKIVQVPFSLPVVDRLRLRKKLFGELDRILESLPLTNFDQTYWGNVYFDGIDHYIRKPRDVVRIVNALSVLYPAAAGEVNPVDFIAIEFLRVFEPEAYGAICTQKDMFVGHLGHSHRADIEPERAFHNAWLERVPVDRRSGVKRLVRHLFPRLEGIWGNMTYGTDWVARWRRELRICSPEIFDVYFQFGVSPDALRRAELDELLAVATQPEQVTNILTSASTVKRPDGSSKAREYLERLQDMEEEITPEAASGLLTSLFDVGDVLLSPQDEQGGFTSIPNRWRLQWATNHLIKRVPENNRDDVLRRLVSQGQALCLVTQIVSTIDDYRSKQDGSRDSPLAQVSEPVLTELKNIVVGRLNRLDEQQLLTMPELPFVIYRWARWSSPELVESRMSPILASDAYLPRFLEKYLRWGVRQGFGDRVACRVPYLNPKDIEVVTDISALESRVQEMLRRTDLTPDQRTAGEQFVNSMERIRQGKDPDGFFMDD
jgi:predicted KAP-like P-loop ATPase